MDRSNHFGKRVRELRIKQNLTQQQLADQVFVARKTISNWESGHRTPDITMLSRLADVLGIKLYDLIHTAEASDSPAGIILVEDEPVILKGFVHILSDALPDAQAIGFQTGAEAVAYARNNRVDVAFLDIELFGESGIDLAGKLSEINPRINIIFLTGHTEYAHDALKLHCSGYILKPLTPDKIRDEIAHLRYPVQELNG